MGVAMTWLKRGPWAWRVFPLVAALTLPGCFSSGESAAEEPARRTVDVATVVSADRTRTVTLSGRVRAAEHAPLSFEVGGRVQYLELEIGDAFEEGQLLARLDDTPYRLALEKARAAAAEAAAQRQEQRLNFQRLSALRERDMISPSRLDEAEAALEMARSRHQSAQASVSIAERDLKQTALHAPFTGSISRRLAEPSERVPAGQPVYEIISDRNGFDVETHLPENLMDALDLGRPQRVYFPALGERVAAEVRHVGSQPTRSNSYPVLLRPDLPEGRALRSGMTAVVELTLRDGRVFPSQSGTWVKVPLTALRYPSDQVTDVLRVGQDNVLEAVPVSVQSTRDGSALVTGPLEAGERIVARGVEFVSPGDSVSVLGQGPERYY